MNKLYIETANLSKSSEPNTTIDFYLKSLIEEFTFGVSQKHNDTYNPYYFYGSFSHAKINIIKFGKKVI
ncbi:hypothetical protein HZS_1033 [Henneguya salminicola]|nr:hypothetical protein HZS_1033 [Henneguya salminicola]